MRLRSIAAAVVIKDEDVFFLTDEDGRVPLRGPHGFGLYYHDCRFLNGYEVKIAGDEPHALTATPRQGYMATLELTSPSFQTADGREITYKDIGLHWERVLDAGNLALHDRIVFRNYLLEPVEFTATFTFQAAFEDMFVVRGMTPHGRGTLYGPEWRGGVLFFLYDGSDGVYRSTQAHFFPAPEKVEGGAVSYTVRLPARGGDEVQISLHLAESKNADDVGPKAPRQADMSGLKASLNQSRADWMKGQTKVRSDSRLLDDVLGRSLHDLRVLRSNLAGEEYFAGGVPWYVTLFGRDSIISSMQMLAFEPAIAAQTLRLLAKYQGSQVDDWREGRPGKILHELRVGELANKGAIPFTPYYGTVDATPLFLILLGRHAEWTGDLKLFHELCDNVERALGWMKANAEQYGNGYLEYSGSTSGHGLSNQGWKDSGVAIMNADGSLAQPPIALVEVQGYAYLAKTLIANLMERSGDGDRAGRLREEAAALRDRFNREFWLDDKGFYALALQAGKQPAAVVASNPGQALWSGIVPPERAGTVAGRLMADDMFNGWGVRTLSEQERRYNPIGYHLGTVWPHDNSLIAAGFRRYGCDDEFRKILNGILQAGAHFPANRLPELFCGFDRQEFPAPVHYPVACHPQAWAAGSVPYLLTTAMGLTPDAFEKRLRVVRPLLPDQVNRVELEGLRVGQARVDLRFQRGKAGGVEVEVLRQEGRLDVQVEKS